MATGDNEAVAFNLSSSHAQIKRASKLDDQVPSAVLGFIQGIVHSLDELIDIVSRPKLGQSKAGSYLSDAIKFTVLYTARGSLSQYLGPLQISLG